MAHKTRPKATHGSARIRFNRIRIGESIIDSTPIFEGSICAFRTKSIGYYKQSNINADDTQLAIIVRKAGFKAIMDGSVEFTDINPIVKRSLRDRRTIGFMKNLELTSNYGNYSSIYSIIYTGNLSIGGNCLFSLAFASTIISLMIEMTKLIPFLQPDTSFVPHPKASRGLLVGSSIMVESQLRLLFGMRCKFGNHLKGITSKYR